MRGGHCPPPLPSSALEHSLLERGCVDAPSGGLTLYSSASGWGCAGVRMCLVAAAPCIPARANESRHFFLKCRGSRLDYSSEMPGGCM